MQPPSGLDVKTTLLHFAIITYLVEPEALRPHVHDRFELQTITDQTGARRALVSVVPFVDVDFHFVRFPWLTWRFGQTNYRAYVYDTVRGEDVVWFFGTALDSWSNFVPRYLWRLPWHRARMAFDCVYDASAERYTRYRLSAESKWAAAKLELIDHGHAPVALAGFDSLESGLRLLTHPMRGYYTRRDGKLGGYTIWHDWLTTHVGAARVARFPLLDRLSLVPVGNTNRIHSILLQHRTEFTIYLPPKQVT